MKASPTRRLKILESLQAGNRIRRFWIGGRRTGYLKHELEGIQNLREYEVMELRKEDIIEVDKTSIATFRSLRLKL